MNNERYLMVALAKGRLAELSMELFMSIGMDCSEMKEKQESLYLPMSGIR